jgi:hypothetical protein
METNTENPLYKSLTDDEFLKLLNEFNQKDETELKIIFINAIEEYLENPDKYNFLCHYLNNIETDGAIKRLEENNKEMVFAKSSYTLITHVFCVKYNNKIYGVCYNIELKCVTSIYRIN